MLAVIVTLVLPNIIAAVSIMSTTPEKSLNASLKNYSLWLLPPKQEAAQIATLSENRGPAFIPHITVVGGIKCDSEDQALEAAHNLQEGLKGFGKISCEFKPVPFSSERVWSQALCLEMESSESFLKLCQTSRTILDKNAENWSFPPPVSMPHLSLFYGVSNIPPKNDMQPVHPFHAYSLALWQTHPATLEGVSSWKEIARIDLR
jgi:hypothetical protein